MKKILYLTFYFEPDLCAGSFRNTPLVKELAKQCKGRADIDVITTLPNRYSTFQADASAFEERDNYTVRRIVIPKHKSGMMDQVLSFKTYYTEVKKAVQDKKYDLVVASSSRLFTAYLGYTIAKKLRVPLYLDIRDIFTDTLNDVLTNKLLKAGVLPILSTIEKRVFNYADHINLISGGFKGYFSPFKCKNYSYYPNGIDDIFLNLPQSQGSTNKVKTITYAGNFGEGQGLHKIVPKAAKRLGKGYKFLLIGDGGAKHKLTQELEALKVDNVEIVDPMNRKDLLESYNKSDFLFIHLNDYDAFKKVLPSKVFELGAYDKPVIAGVAGFANNFIEENLNNKILFLPGDVDDMVNQLNNYTYRNEVRTSFIEKYKREEINREMAKSIVSYL
ncbi:MAG: glycosyltransferase WbuB [Pedobacter sp.]|nr:MAG: glycosyltransferase WbuB [Pedobacter sp.]